MPRITTVAGRRYPGNPLRRNLNGRSVGARPGPPRGAGGSALAPRRRCQTERVPLPLILAGPLSALAIVACLALVLRWTFGTGQPARPWSAPEDFGLLSTVATVDDPETASGVRRVLGEAGIRSTVAVTRDARVSVLVFDSELDRARRLVN